MKKIFLMIAAVVMFTACNGSTATDSTTPSDSVATEQAAEENEEAVVEKTGPCSIESDDLILDVPEGWKAT